MKHGQKQRLSGPTVFRAAASDAHIISEDERRFRLSFSSEEPYERRSWFDDPWVEVLGHKDDEVVMDRFTSGTAPLLYGHNGYARSEHIGVIEKAWLENGRGMAEVRLSKREDLNDLWQDIRDGIVRNVSVGYRIIERTLTKENRDGPSEYRVTRWEPMEASLVPIPADATVGVGRSDDAGGQFVITDLPEETEERPMTTKATAPAKPDDTAAPGAAVEEEQRQAAEDAQRAAAEAEKRGAQAERKRVSDINDVVTKAGLDQAFANQLIADGVSVDEARAKVIDKIAESDRPRRPSGQVVEDAADKKRAAAEQWLLARIGHQDEKGARVVATGDNPYRGAKLLDIAKDCLQRAGVNTTGLFGQEIAMRAIMHSTSDFAVILENTMHKTLLGAFMIAGDSWRAFCAVGDLSDFRPHNRYLTGSFSDLLVRNENGEYQDGTLDDARKETIQAQAKGRILGITREMIVNDDMGVFTGASRMMGRAANRTLEQDVYALLALGSDFGPVMSDGVTLFHANHGNVTTGAPSVTTIEAAVNVLKSQQFPNASSGAVEYLDLQMPPVFVGPLSLSGDARVINEAQYDPDTANKLQKPNKSRGLLSTIVGTPRRTGTPWFLFADPAEMPVIEVGFVDGVQTPRLEMREAFRQDGLQWRVVFEYGVAAVNWMGCVRSTGA